MYWDHTCFLVARDSCSVLCVFNHIRSLQGQSEWKVHQLAHCHKMNSVSASAPLLSVGTLERGLPSNLEMRTFTAKEPPLIVLTKRRQQKKTAIQELC